MTELCRPIRVARCGSHLRLTDPTGYHAWSWLLPREPAIDPASVVPSDAENIMQVRRGASGGRMRSTLTMTQEVSGVSQSHMAEGPARRLTRTAARDSEATAAFVVLLTRRGGQRRCQQPQRGRLRRRRRHPRCVQDTPPHFSKAEDTDTDNEAMIIV